MICTWTNDLYFIILLSEFQLDKTCQLYSIKSEISKSNASNWVLNYYISMNMSAIL